MKIHGQPISADVDASGAASRTAATQGKDKDSRVKGAQTGQITSDRVEVSSDARLRSAALTAAEATPAIRQDRVDAVRQKLANGEIGNDVNRLADSLLDNLIGQDQ